MTPSKAHKARDLYIGVDVGGTNIQAVLATAAGVVRSRAKNLTPRSGGHAPAVEAIAKTVTQAIQKASLSASDVAGIGLALPGVVDPQAGKVLVTPNMELGGCDIVAQLQKHVQLPIALGNDVDMGTLGEKWLGAARDAGNVVGIFPGTGIGGGIILDGKLLRGSHETAGEIGHMIMQIDGPRCGCGAKGCFEALASRTAIERDIRKAIADGEKSVVSDLAGKKGHIRSSVLARALQEKDKVVTNVLRDACDVIGQACISIQHILDPEVIVLGGGILEACGSFMMPRIERAVHNDPFAKGRRQGRILLSTLGDDAVALGAIALLQQSLGLYPFRRRNTDATDYPTPQLLSDGEVGIGGKAYDRDVYVRPSGKVKKRKKGDLKKNGSRIGPDLIKKICKGGPERLYVGVAEDQKLKLTTAAENLLRYRAIDLQQLPIDEAIEAFNASRKRKSLFLRIGR
jgi:glucokinase